MDLYSVAVSEDVAAYVRGFVAATPVRPAGRPHRVTRRVRQQRLQGALVGRAADESSLLWCPDREDQRSISTSRQQQECLLRR